MLCKWNYEREYNELIGIKEEIILNNSSIKYNFRIQPFNNTENFSSYDSGSTPLYFYPKVLDFNLYDTITINYIMDNPSNTQGIRLIYNSDDLECNNDNKMLKTCKVNRDFFENAKHGYYYTYHKVQDDIYSIYYELTPFEVIIPDDNKIFVNIIEKENAYIGEKGNFYLNTDFHDEENIFNISDIEEKTSFDTFIYLNNNEGEKYTIICRLWKQVNNNLTILCKMDNIFSFVDLYVNFEKCLSIYNNYRITLKSLSKFHLIYLNSSLPFLYSEQQIIRIEDNKEYYELKLKTEEYNNEILYLYSNDAYISLDKCSKKTNELICKIEKGDIEEVLLYNNQKFDIFSYHESFGKYKIKNIDDIIVIDNRWEKQDIFVGIVKLLQKYIDQNNYITYETNITSISNIVSDKFELKNNNNKNITCYLKKT